MDNNIVRIKQVEILNIKNVEYGKIVVSTNKQIIDEPFSSDIIGIYGQNGSGKTAFVDALCLARYLLAGDSLPEDTESFIFLKSSSAIIKMEFNIWIDSGIYHVFYDVEIEKKEDKGAKVVKENLAYKEYVDNKWNSKRNIFNYETFDNQYILKPIKNYKLIIKDGIDRQADLMVAKKFSNKANTSFIFSKELKEIIEKVEEFSIYSVIISSLKKYSVEDLFIIRSHHLGLINIDLLIPFSFRIKSTNKLEGGEFPISLVGPSVLSLEIYDTTKLLLKQINMVLSKLIPGLTIALKDLGKELKEDAKEGMRVELISLKKDIELPLKNESDGIKRIISLLSALIAMYNRPTSCIVVDELDAGVFEYLLGEILKIIKDNGKGQFLFTSHNLRPLEILDTTSIVFTTSNATNRYITLSNVKSNNNLRDLYYRSILLGGQREELYEDTNYFEINRAFRKAGELKQRE